MLDHGNKNMKEKKNTRPQPTVLKSLDALTGLVDSPIRCVFTIDRRPVEIEVKRMTAAIAERKRKIERAVQPPYKPERKDYDPLDPKYLDAREAAEAKAQAVVVYFCCPIVQAKKACATDEEIAAFVATVLPPNLQQIIALTAQGGGLGMEDAANFITPPASED